MRNHTLATLVLAALLAACGAQPASPPPKTIYIPPALPSAAAVETPAPVDADAATPAAALPSLVYYRISKH